ncbi:hypothetical protein MFORT_23547 [Mycolicibacterium fortuitum subsp. fortuitum DSM 46621 = ATCC 6841 = JCM 6387]|uniref:Uncharacterized protein n=1 Tax=Mycolicibacterium fortuitum subsp. fortuitum DSM 46621 = ATCC 6841 = JCM 6387 TaxID=1214102 RepID=K0UVB7_MYCFO|nr:hypothetical protein MFORT_23547 [Mycolicibacterium fortuitum subsp. fortuitum DSM 46621 = ATCC 6841 = JCM 6387]
MPAEPSDGDSVADREITYAGPNFGDGSGNLVAWGHRPRGAREAAVEDGPIGAAHAARRDRDPNLSPIGRDGLGVNEFEGAAG